MNEELGNLMDFIYFIFAQPPKNPKTAHLSLDYSHLGPKDNLVVYQFNQLRDIFIAGCKLKFGEIILLEKFLHSDQHDLMKKYFQSFGYHLYVDTEHKTPPVQANTTGESNASYVDDQETPLVNYFLKINRNGQDYYIYFSKMD